MATLSFKLRKTSIQLFFNYGQGNRFRYSTGLKLIDSKHWDKNKMRIKNVLAEINKDAINSKLDATQTEFNKKYIQLSLNSEINVNNELLREVADKIFNKSSQEEIEEKRELLPFFEWFLKYYELNPIPTTGKPLGKGTLKTYKNTYSKLKKFDKEVYKLSYRKITLSFYEDFVEWLYENNYSTNYIGTIIKILKTIMNFAYEKDLHSNLDFKKSGFKKPSEEVTNIYLDENELEQLMTVDLSSVELLITKSGVRLNREKLERARDLFLISAYTGLRVSDFNRLTLENFVNKEGTDYLVIETQKTLKTIAIPLHRIVKEILKKRGGNPPESLPEQHINYAIKEVAKIAGIDEIFSKKITKGGNRITINLKKYELISNHTGRRSFCTNAYLSGISTVDIMAISGHNSEKVFYNYIKADHLQKAEKISQYPFFK